MAYPWLIQGAALIIQMQSWDYLTSEQSQRGH